MNSSTDVLYRTTLKGTVILLPLLGLTWVFGIFAVKENTVVFAWLFTIFNSLQVRYPPSLMYCWLMLCKDYIIIIAVLSSLLQGLFIFILHVLRNERVCDRCTHRQTHTYIPCDMGNYAFLQVWVHIKERYDAYSVSQGKIQRQVCVYPIWAICSIILCCEGVHNMIVMLSGWCSI